MIVGLVVVFGAVVGFACFTIYGSGYGLLWDVILGIAGSIMSSAIMTAAYVMNNFGRTDVIGLNWYSMTIGTAGALIMIYTAWLYNKAYPI